MVCACVHVRADSWQVGGLELGNHPASGSRFARFGAGVCNGKHLRRVLGHLKRALRMEQRLTLEEFYQQLQLSQVIIDYANDPSVLPLHRAGGWLELETLDLLPVVPPENPQPRL